MFLRVGKTPVVIDNKLSCEGEELTVSFQMCTLHLESLPSTYPISRLIQAQQRPPRHADHTQSFVKGAFFQSIYHDQHFTRMVLAS
jgi:hypothetical protein